MKHLKIKINNLEFDGETVLKDIDFVLNKTDRVAIVGANGAGKTTLLKVLTGEIKGYDGSIDNVGNLTLGYLKQIHSNDETKLVRQELKEAFTQIIETEKKLDEIEKKMAINPHDLEVIESYSSLLEIFNNIGGNDYNNKIHNVASGIGILELIDKKLNEVSGGQRTKIALAKVLLESPDILFLDEPTNFIDMGSVEWLESFLQNKWKSGYVIISHDREFLDRTCNLTYEVQPKRGITYYHTNYTGYLEERERIENKKMENFKREQEFIEKEEKLIDRFRAGSRAGWAKSREKALDRRDIVEPPYIPKKPKFFFNFTGELPEKVLSFKECFIGRKEPLFFINEVNLYKKQRIGVVGENGVGKSTFLKTIMRELDVLDGMYNRGKGIQIGYYSQLHEELRKDKTVRENFELAGINYPEQNLIGLIKHYLFEKEDLDKKVSDLSGGQTSKLLFAILGQKEYNLLILDEPTNHLDYDTRESLEQALKEFEGSILFISHDRYFVNKLATNIWFITNNELSVSYGNYEDYRYKLEHNIDMDMSLFDEEAELNLVLEEKLGEKEFKRLKEKFSGKKHRRK
ncbi:MAG: ABC-F family ATP-binding cassette domain-containing protein [Candidatus Gracilibacteria bacterium]|nr:ABC-F family ATP-binding cassette domain-containing protein [Candidatus Gracilibacteria bacterium]